MNNCRTKQSQQIHFSMTNLKHAHTHSKWANKKSRTNESSSVNETPMQTPTKEQANKEPERPARQIIWKWKARARTTACASSCSRTREKKERKTKTAIKLEGGKASRSNSSRDIEGKKALGCADSGLPLALHENSRCPPYPSAEDQKGGNRSWRLCDSMRFAQTTNVIR